MVDEDGFCFGEDTGKGLRVVDFSDGIVTLVQHLKIVKSGWCW